MILQRALRLPAVMEVTGLAKPTIYKYIGLGKFPPGNRRSDVRMRTWEEGDIAAWKRGEWKAAEAIA